MAIYFVWWGVAACAVIFGCVGIFRSVRPHQKVLKRSVSVLDIHHAPLVVYRSSWFLRSSRSRH